MAGSIELYGFEPNSMAEEIASLFQQWDSGRQVWLKRVREVIQYVYATSTRETTNNQNGWSHSTHVPKITQIHDNLGANYASALIGRRKFFTFEPNNQNEATAAKRKAIENYLGTKHDSNNFSQTVLHLLNDWVQTGNCFAYIEYVRETTKDIDETEVVTYEGPRVVRVSPFDVVFDHTCQSFAKAPKIFRRLLTRGDILRKMEESMDMKFDEAEVKRLLEFRSTLSGMSDAEINKKIQMRLDGFSDTASYIRSGNIEILEFIGDIYNPYTNELEKDRVITVADRRFIIRNAPQAEYSGLGKMLHCGWRKRPDNLWAQGPLDNLVGMQYLVNHLENARADAFDQMLTPDRVHVGNVSIEKDGPVTNYFIDDAGGDVRNLAPDATILQADMQIQMKENQMEAYAGAPREAMGIRTAGEKTAFEVQSLQNAASRLFQIKIEQFEREMLEPLLNAELESAVKNLTTADLAKTMDDDEGVVEFITITKEDLTARGKLKARGASHFAKRAQLVQELQSFGQVLASDPEMKVHFPAKNRAKAWADALHFDGLEIYKPFGALEEQIELQQMQQAAMGVVEENMAAEQQMLDEGI